MFKFQVMLLRSEPGMFKFQVILLRDSDIGLDSVMFCPMPDDGRHRGPVVSSWAKPNCIQSVYLTVTVRARPGPASRAVVTRKARRNMKTRNFRQRFSTPGTGRRASSAVGTQ